MFVLLELVWLRYFVPMSVAAAVGLGVAMGALRARSGRVELDGVLGGRRRRLPWPGERRRVRPRRPERPHSYRDDELPAERYSAFESAKQAADSRFRRDARLRRRFARLGRHQPARCRRRRRRHVRRPELLLAVRSGSPAGRPGGCGDHGTTGSAVARQLASHGIDAVFVPSWFWEPGGARHPLADRSPVALWVGAPALRALRVYLPDSNVTYPSVLYVVGSTPSARRRVGSLLRSPMFSVEGAPSTRRKLVRGGFARLRPARRATALACRRARDRERRTVDPPDDEGPRRGSRRRRLRAESAHAHQPGSVRRLHPRRSVCAGEHRST